MDTRTDILLLLIDELQRFERLLGGHAKQNHALAAMTRERISASLTRMEKSHVD